MVDKLLRMRRAPLASPSIFSVRPSAHCRQSPSDAHAADVLLKQGLALHQQGRLESAQAVYEQVVAQNAQHFDALNLLGLICAQQRNPSMAVHWLAQALAVDSGRVMAHVAMGLALFDLRQFEEALASYERALALDGAHAQAWTCRGDALLELRRHQEACESFARALALEPCSLHALSGCGLALHAIGCFEEALARYDQALTHQPGHALTHYHRGNVLQALSRLEDALASYDKAVALAPAHWQAHCNRGNVLQKLLRLDAAVGSYDLAIALKPDAAEIFYNRGGALHLLGRDAQAIASYDQALAIDPSHAQAHCNRGNSLQALLRLDEALASYEQAIACDPGYADAHYNRGNALHEAQCWEKAIASFDQAIAINPGHAPAYYNRGNAFKELNRPKEAVASLDRAIALEPDRPESHWNRSIALLLDGQFSPGWQAYEWRWKTPSAGFVPRTLPQPLWLGQPCLQGKTILLYGEQGLGDTLQFCRYAKWVKALGARVLMEIPASLMGLLGALEGVDARIEAGQPLPEFDVQTPLLSLPLALGTQLHTIPSPDAYLQADPRRVAVWEALLGPRRGLRVGLVWRGNPLHRNDHRRSVPLSEVVRHLPKGLDFVSLQKDLGDGDALLLKHSGIRHFGDHLQDFQDTAALCRALDLVVCVDTSMAHLAGALGRPCWVMLPHVPDWRWLLEREDSPWYASIRLFRQDHSRSWPPVLSRIAQALADLAA